MKSGSVAVAAVSTAIAAPARNPYAAAMKTAGAMKIGRMCESTPPVAISMKPRSTRPGITMTTRNRSTGKRCQGKNQLTTAPT